MGSIERARAALLALICGIAGLGCGEMTIRTWITVVEDESGGSVLLGGAPPGIPVERLQGGFLTETRVDTRQILGDMEGTIRLLDVRMAGEIGGGIGKLCTWNHFLGESVGTLKMNLLEETLETELFLDAKATTEISDALGVKPVDFEEFIDFDLGANFSVATFLGAFVTGSTEGLFETSSLISSTVEVLGQPATFELDAAITSGPLPPTFDTDLLEYCQPYFRRQVFRDGIYYNLNAKSSYMRHLNNDRPTDPLMIVLDEIDAQPGDTVRLKTHGAYSGLTLAADGKDTRLGGVFSATDELRDSSYLDRIPGAVPVPGHRINTWISIVCFFGICDDWGGDDIPQDFQIDPMRVVTVPEGAEYLFVAPIDGWRTYEGNTGLGFGMTVEVNPTY